MQCEEVRLTLLRESPDATADPDAYGAARAHFGECEECRRVINWQWKLARRIQVAGRSVRVPDTVRARVAALLQDGYSAEKVSPVRAEARSRAAWLRAPVLVAAAASILFLVSTVLRNRPDDLGPAFVAAVLADGQADSDRTSSDSVDLASWLEARVGYSVEIPNITDAVPTGGRVAEVGALRVAAIRFRVDQATLWYFALPPASAGDEKQDGAAVETLSTAGYEVATWSEFGAQRAVVAMMPRNKLRAIAEECRNAALGRTTL